MQCDAMQSLFLETQESDDGQIWDYQQISYTVAIVLLQPRAQVMILIFTLAATLAQSKAPVLRTGIGRTRDYYLHNDYHNNNK